MCLQRATARQHNPRQRSCHASPTSWVDEFEVLWRRYRWDHFCLLGSKYKMCRRGNLHCLGSSGYKPGAKQQNSTRDLDVFLEHCSGNTNTPPHRQSETPWAQRWFWKPVWSTLKTLHYSSAFWRSKLWLFRTVNTMHLSERRLVTRSVKWTQPVIYLRFWIF
jgi:hypothetical protein